jgi:hypothetical protein
MRAASPAAAVSLVWALTIASLFLMPGSSRSAWSPTIREQASSMLSFTGSARSRAFVR